MTIDELVEELLDIRKVVGNVDVVRAYTVCGEAFHAPLRVPFVTVNQSSVKVVEVL